MNKNFSFFAKQYAAVFIALVGTSVSLAAGTKTLRQADVARENYSASKFVHPGIAHTTESITFVKEKIKSGDEPWASAWKKLERSRYAEMRRRPRPYAHVERGPYNDPDIGAGDFIHDGSSAYTHALLWVLTDQEKHALKAAEILNAWSQTLETVSNHDAKLLIGMSGQHYCNAAELIKHTSDVWPKSDQAQFEAMIREVWHPVIKNFYPSANGNWDASMIQTLMAMAVFLDDRAMFDKAVNYYLKGKGNGAVLNYFNEFGQCQESGRDQGHTQMGLDFLATACETAWNQGLDLYGAYDNRLLKGFEYTAKYNLGYDVPYEPYSSFDGRYLYKHISDDSRGRIRPMYEKIYNHFHNRKGLEATYTMMAIEQTRPESRGGTTLPWGTLMYANQPKSFDKVEAQSNE